VKKQFYWLLGIGLVAFLARLLFLVIFGGLDNDLHDSSPDQALFIDLARNMVAGHGFTVSTDYWVATAGKPTSLMPPFYPLFLAFCFKIFGENFIVVRLIQVLLSVSIPVMVYFIGRIIFNRPVGLIAAAGTALYPPLVMYVRPLMSESLFYPMLVGLALLTCLLVQPDPKKWLYPLWGLLAGVSILTRSEVALVVGLLLLYLGFHHLRAYRLSRKTILTLSFTVIVLALTLVPYASYNYAAHGNFSPLPNKKWTFWDSTWMEAMRNTPEWQGVSLPERKVVPNWYQLTEIERDNYLWNMGVQYVLQHPDVYLSQRARYFLWSFPVLPVELFRTGQADGAKYGPTSLDDRVQYVTLAEQVRVWVFRLMLVLALGGIGMNLFYYKYRQKAFTLYIILGWNLFLAIAFNGSERMRLQVDSFFMLFAAFFIYELWFLQKARARVKRLQVQKTEAGFEEQPSLT